ncbi:hypothetical protein AGR1A_Cc20134 [Agrobacterium fabacearum CFBP 5771]|nr:hypothetical protein AGR1A_Cc20134 [Agrobacterium fabacearum CFBP 5771]
MFAAHMPAAVRAFVSPRLYLNGTKPVANIIRDYDIGIRHSSWS